MRSGRKIGALKPESLDDAVAVACEAYGRAPTLIPIFSHRYLPATPCEAGNPVFSVYQTDIIYYGADLFDYLQNEFKGAFGRTKLELTRTPRERPFWSAIEAGWGSRSIGS